MEDLELKKKGWENAKECMFESIADHVIGQIFKPQNRKEFIKQNMAWYNVVLQTARLSCFDPVDFSSKQNENAVKVKRIGKLQRDFAFTDALKKLDHNKKVTIGDLKDFFNQGIDYGQNNVIVSYADNKVNKD